MKRLARVKPIARWTAWVLAVLLPAMWVASMWWTIVLTIPGGVRGPQAVICLGGGGFSVAYVSHIERTDIGALARHIFHRTPYGLALETDSLIASKIQEHGVTGAFIPVWMPWLIAIGASIWFFRDHQREKMRRIIGRCPACGYDRSGLPQSAPCPECAAPATHR